MPASLPIRKRTVHVVPVILKAPANPGSVEDQLVIAIVGQDDPITISDVWRDYRVAENWLQKIPSTVVVSRSSSVRDVITA